MVKTLQPDKEISKSNITLVENYKVVPKDKKLSVNFSKSFQNAVKNLDIREYNTSVPSANNPIDTVIETFRVYPCIRFIKKCNFCNL